MAASVSEPNNDNDSKTEELSAIYTEKLENIQTIRNNLESLIKELDDHDQTLTKGFNDIQTLIDQQRKKFKDLSNEFDKAQQIHNNNTENKPKSSPYSMDPSSNGSNIENPEQKPSINSNDDDNKSNDDIDNDTEYPLIDITLNPLPPIPTLNDIELPPKREPIKILPFEAMQIDFDFLNKQMEIANTVQLKPEEDEQYDDIKVTDDETKNAEDDEKKQDLNGSDIETEDDGDIEEEEEEEEDEMDETMIAMLQKEKSENLMTMDLPKDVQNILGDRKKWKKLPKKKKLKAAMERDIRKITESLKDLDENERKYAKLSILKYYDILYETFKKYCKIGGDKDWLNNKGWQALYKDAFIADKKSEECKDEQCRKLFQIIYDAHHSSKRHKTASKHNKNMMTTALNLAEWNDDNPWTGTWKQDTSDSGGAAEEYKLKQLGDTKLIGFIKNFDFCDINGSIYSSKRIKSQFIIFWHEGARKGKRRICKCTLNKPSNIRDAVTMTVEWKSIASSSNVNTGTAEEGTYTMTKYEGLSDEDDKKFKYTIGLARHEYFDAMLFLSKMKYPDLKNKRYEGLCRLCEDYLIPYIWGGMDKAIEATIKSIFRPHSTELHKLFGKYNSIDSTDGTDDSLLGLDEWQVFCFDVLKQDKNAFNKGGKPTNNDIIAAFELAKDAHDLELTYKGFETALKEFAKKIYKKRPKQKYISMSYNDKLKKLLKWTVKLQKSGYQPTMSKK